MNIGRLFAGFSVAALLACGGRAQIDHPDSGMAPPISDSGTVTVSSSDAGTAGAGGTTGIPCPPIDAGRAALQQLDGKPCLVEGDECYPGGCTEFCTCVLHAAGHAWQCLPIPCIK